MSGLDDYTEQARDAQDAGTAEIEAYAKDLLRDLSNYEDLLGRVAEDEDAQMAALAMVTMPPTQLVSISQMRNALLRAAIEKAREEME